MTAENRRTAPLLFIAFFAVGALIMTVLRAPDEAGAADSHAARRAKTAHETHSGHAAQPASSDAPGHSDHTAHAQPAASGEKKAPAKPREGTADVWVCEKDPTVGLSFEGKCPLDGKPTVKAQIPWSQLTDLQNPKCPIMGGKSQDSVFAIWKSELVHFCCPGCQTRFFEKADEHVQKIKAGKTEKGK